MPLSIKDLRLTVRRQGDEAFVYPRLMRDRAALPKLAIAIEHFEASLGKERREIDAEVLVSFFGDHKLARCVVAALGRTYRFHRRRMAELVTKTAARRLAKAGLLSPVDLRLALFDHVNSASDGFTSDAERPAAYAALEAQIGLKAGDIAKLLYLDADERAVLRRAGERAQSEDAAAQFNLLTLETLLRQAEQITLAVAKPSDALVCGAAALAQQLDVELTLDHGERRLRLRGQQDALGNWSRHGRRLARLLVALLERDADAFGDGEATLALPGRRATLRLTAELRRCLSGGAPPTGWEGGADADAAHAAVLPALRALGTVRRLPEAQAWQSGVFLPDLRLVRDDGATLLCLVRGESHARRLAAVAPRAVSGDPLLCVGSGPALELLRAAGVRIAETAALASGEWALPSAA